MRPADHLRGVLVAAVGLCFVILGMPGMDLLHADRWKPGSRDREVALAQFWGPFAVGAADLNRAVREPVVAWLAPLQRPLRLAQSWGLYGAGSTRLRWLEIYVDEELVFRSNDPEHDWLGPVLRYRRIRPVVEAHCRKVSKNSRGLERFILRRAREDFPRARQVRIQCVERPREAPGPRTVVQRKRAGAPDWRLHP